MPDDGAKQLFYSLRSVLRQILPARSRQQHRLVVANRAYALARQRLFVGMTSELHALQAHIAARAPLVIVKGAVGSGQLYGCPSFFPCSHPTVLPCFLPFILHKTRVREAEGVCVSVCV